jgi:catechol 2,3-dioxygenase-like lactoylglutathione lyase family enzyme
MPIRSISHMALRVPSLPAAERLYATLFGLEVAYREAETPDGWRTLRDGHDWESGMPAGVDPGMTVMYRDGFRLAIEASEGVAEGGALDHVGLLVDGAELAATRFRAGDTGCTVEQDSPGRLILNDPLGIRWELTSSIDEDPRAASHGARDGRWIDSS